MFKKALRILKEKKSSNILIAVAPLLDYLRDLVKRIKTCHFKSFGTTWSYEDGCKSKSSPSNAVVVKFMRP